MAENAHNVNGSAANPQRCPGCFKYADNIRAFAVYIHEKTGRRLAYTLCDFCVMRLQRVPHAVIRNVESYYAEEIAQFEAEAAEGAGL